MAVLIVHGEVQQQRVGLLRASLILLWDLWRGYYNTLWTRTENNVKVRQIERDGKYYMVFEVEQYDPGSPLITGGKVETQEG